MLHTQLLEIRAGKESTNATAVATCSKEMSLTPEQFIRALAPVLEHEGGTVTHDRSQVAVNNGSRGLTLRFRPRPSRKLGALTLPVLKVDLRFEGYSGTQIKRFSDRFDLAFLRMGG